MFALLITLFDLDHYSFRIRHYYLRKSAEKYLDNFRLIFTSFSWLDKWLRMWYQIGCCSIKNLRSSGMSFPMSFFYVLIMYTLKSRNRISILQTCHCNSNPFSIQDNFFRLGYFSLGTIEIKFCWNCYNFPERAFQ